MRGNLEIQHYGAFCTISTLILLWWRHILRLKKQSVHHLLSSKRVQLCFQLANCVDWGEIWAIHRWADMPTLRLARSQTQICTIFHGLCVRIEYPAALKKTLSFDALRKESVAELSGRKEAATWFLHYSGSGLNGSFSPADIVRLWNAIRDPGGGSLEKAWALSGRWIREQCQICCSLISPIYHCLLRSAREPPGCKRQYQLSSVNYWNQTPAYKSEYWTRSGYWKYSAGW